MLEAWTPADAEALLAILQRDDVRRQLYAMAPRVPTVDELRDVWLQHPPRCEARWVVRERAGGPPRGCVMVDDQELSYFVDPAHWGRGLATRAVRALALARADRAHRPLLAWVERCNMASRKVLERAGFRFVGLQHRGPIAAAWLRYMQLQRQQQQGGSGA